MVRNLTWPSWLCDPRYVTAGLAYARVKQTLNDDCVGCGNSPFNFGPFSQSNKEFKAGWTVGTGAEYLRDARWLFRAEVLYVDLGPTPSPTRW